MPSSKKQKITDEDVQAYLLGEGSKDIYAKIHRVDEAAVSSLTGDDLKVKETLESFRQVDKLFSEAIDKSIGVPSHLLKQIDDVLHAPEQHVKKNITERLKIFLNTQFSFGSVFAGGAVGVFATVAFLNVSPMLTFGINQNLNNPVFRSASQDETTPNVLNQLDGDINWQVKDVFAYKFVVFSASGIQRSNTNVTIGETFDLAILPLKNGSLSIHYINSDGEKQIILDNEYLMKGVEFRLSNNIFKGERPMFGAPIGIDKMVLFHENKIVEMIEILVK